MRFSTLLIFFLFLSACTPNASSPNLVNTYWKIPDNAPCHFPIYKIRFDSTKGILWNNFGVKETFDYSLEKEKLHIVLSTQGSFELGLELFSEDSLGLSSWADTCHFQKENLKSGNDFSIELLGMDLPELDTLSINKSPIKIVGLQKRALNEPLCFYTWRGEKHLLRDLPSFFMRTSPQVMILVDKEVALSDLIDVYLCLQLSQVRRVFIAMNQVGLGEGYGVLRHHVHVWEKELQDFANPKIYPPIPPVASRKEFFNRHPKMVSYSISDLSEVDALVKKINEGKTSVMINLGKVKDLKTYFLIKSKIRSSIRVARNTLALEEYGRGWKQLSREEKQQLIKDRLLVAFELRDYLF